MIALKHIMHVQSIILMIKYSYTYADTKIQAAVWTMKEDDDTKISEISKVKEDVGTKISELTKRWSKILLLSNAFIKI